MVLLHGALAARAHPRRARTVQGPAARDLAPRRGAGRAGAVVVRLPEREPDRRAVARPGCARRAHALAPGRRGQGSRRPGRLRLRPSRDPLGPRRRGPRAGGRARARAGADRVAERRPCVCAGGRGARGGAAGCFGKEWAVSSRTCPDWPLLMEIAPSLQFMHHTVAEAKIPAEALAELVDVPLQAVAICADLDHNVFNAAHTEPKVAEALRNTYWFELREWATRGPGQAA